MSKALARKIAPSSADYHQLALDISHLVEQARLKAAQSVNASWNMSRAAENALSMGKL